MAGTDASSTRDEPDFSICSQGDADVVILEGVLSIHTVSRLDAALGRLPARATKLDLGGVTQFDTAGAWSIARLERRLSAAGQPLDLVGASRTRAELIATAREAISEARQDDARSHWLSDRLEEFGRRVVGFLDYGLALLGFLGVFVSRLGRSIRHPGEFPLTALVHHCQEVGLKAVPIVSLMAFLIGVVLAFQGSAQLRQFGAEVFVVDLIAISILRELGILLTSIIVAGRTASAFTAAIGSMKMREEIDAMRTLGLDPASVLFLPRILALIVMLPILGLIANVMGLLGGAIMSWIELGISPAMFQTRLVDGTDVSHVMVGMVKAPVFALIIGVIGCQSGMQVESDTDSLGRQTSNAVVAAIFTVILADAGFSVFFAQVGI